MMRSFRMDLRILVYVKWTSRFQVYVFLQEDSLLNVHRERSMDEFSVALGPHSNLPPPPPPANCDWRRGQLRRGKPRDSAPTHHRARCRMPQWHNIVLKTFVQCLHPTLEELSQWERSMRSQVWRTRPVPLVNDVTRTNEVDWRISGEPRTRNQARCRIHYFRMKMTAAKSFEHFFRIRKLMKAVSAP